MSSLKLETCRVKDPFSYVFCSRTEHVGERVEYNKEIMQYARDWLYSVEKVNSWWWAPWSSKHVELKDD